MHTFSEKVLLIVSKIPQGTVMTYKEVSLKAGKPNGSRVVGMIMSKNQDKNIPCHRVVGSTGNLAGYNGLRSKEKGVSAKQVLLQKEGVLFSTTGKVIFNVKRRTK